MLKVNKIQDDNIKQSVLNILNDLDKQERESFNLLNNFRKR